MVAIHLESEPRMIGSSDATTADVDLKVASRDGYQWLDFDDDGSVDLVLTSAGGLRVSRQIESGRLEPFRKTDVPNEDRLAGVFIDLDGDGQLDFVVSTGEQSTGQTGASELRVFWRGDE